MNLNQIQDEIIEEFSLFEDWLEIYEHLISLANGLEPMDDRYKTDNNSISGCQSELWVFGGLENGRMKYYADSNTLITKGISSLILRVVNNQPPREIITADLYFIDKIGLSSNLSPARSNGISSILKKVKEDAEKVV